MPFATETIHPPTVARLLRGIDTLPSGATGAFVLSSSRGAQGAILVEDRRVCWAAATNMENRLTDLLRCQDGVTAPVEAFEEVFEDCHRSQKPLGETLVRRGLVSREGLKSALREHSAEALARLSTVPRLTLDWTPCGTRKYDAQFTFGSVELLCSVGAIGREVTAADAASKLFDVTPEGSVGLAYLADSPYTVLLAQISAEAWACDSLVELGEWARRSLSSGEAGSVLASDTVHSLRRAWRSGDLVLVRWTGDVEPEPAVRAQPFDLARQTVLTR